MSGAGTVGVVARVRAGRQKGMRAEPEGWAEAGADLSSLTVRLPHFHEVLLTNLNT